MAFIKCRPAPDRHIDMHRPRLYQTSLINRLQSIETEACEDNNTRMHLSQPPDNPNTNIKLREVPSAKLVITDAN